MATPKKTKDLARRIDPSYHRRLHPFRRQRLLLCAGLCAAAGVWVLSAFALGHESIYVRGGVAAAHARKRHFLDIDMAITVPAWY